MTHKSRQESRRNVINGGKRLDSSDSCPCTMKARPDQPSTEVKGNLITHSSHILVVIFQLLTLRHLGNFSCFLLSAVFSQNQIFGENSVRITIRVSNSLDPDQAHHFVWPDLGQNCLQKLSADQTSGIYMSWTVNKCLSF